MLEIHLIILLISKKIPNRCFFIEFNLGFFEFQLLRALRRTMKQRRKVSNVSKAKVMSNESNRASLSSVNNDWKHWLALHGDEKTVNKDVCDITHTVGLKFQGDKNNMFDVLSGTGRKNNGDGGNRK